MENSTDTATGTYRVAAQYGRGKVHVASSSRLRAHHTLGCTGRTTSGCYRTDAPVDCRACLKRFAGDAAALGIDPMPPRTSDGFLVPGVDVPAVFEAVGWCVANGVFDRQPSAATGDARDEIAERGVVEDPRPPVATATCVCGRPIRGTAKPGSGSRETWIHTENVRPPRYGRPHTPRPRQPAAPPPGHSPTRQPDPVTGETECVCGQSGCTLWYSDLVPTRRVQPVTFPVEPVETAELLVPREDLRDEADQARGKADAARAEGDADAAAYHVRYADALESQIAAGDPNHHYHRNDRGRYVQCARPECLAGRPEAGQPEPPPDPDAGPERLRNLFPIGPPAPRPRVAGRGYMCPRAGCENTGGRLDWCQEHDVRLVRDRRPARSRQGEAR